MDDSLAPLVGALGGLAALLLLASVAARSSALLPWAVAAAGAEYATFLVVRETTVDAAAPLYAAGLLVVAELAYWSLERGVPSDGDALVGRRLSLVAAVALAAGGIGGMVLTIAELSVSGGLALELLGVAAAVGVLAIVGALARRV